MTILVSGGERRKRKSSLFLFKNPVKKLNVALFSGVVPESLGEGVAWTQGQSDADRSVERWRDGVGNLQLRSESAYLFVYDGESIQNKTIKTKKIGSLSHSVELVVRASLFPPHHLWNVESGWSEIWLAERGQTGGGARCSWGEGEARVIGERRAFGEIATLIDS